eukprot:3686380-Pyramimonas_sp.AAC.1
MTKVTGRDRSWYSALDGGFSTSGYTDRRGWNRRLPKLPKSVVIGTAATVEGSTVDVKGSTLDVKGSTVDVKGSTVDVKGSTVDVKGSTVDVKGFLTSARAPLAGYSEASSLLLYFGSS